MHLLNSKLIATLNCHCLLILLIGFVQVTKAQTESTKPVSKPFAFTNVSIIDVMDGTIRPNKTVIITNERITSIGHADSLKVPGHATIIKAKGKYLIPGLWDMHLHRSWNYFGAIIANGVTGVRDMGNPLLSLEEIEELRQKIRNGHIIGPRIVTPGHQVINKSTNDRRVEATTPKRGRQVVDSLKAAGADFIKVYNLSRQTFFAIADQAEKRGIPIAGHLSPDVTLAEAGKAGQKSIEHFTVFKPFGLIPLCSSQPEKHRRLLDELKSIGVPPTDSVHIAHRHSIAKLTVESYDEDRCRRETKRLAEYNTWHTPTLMMGMMYPRIHDDKILQDPRFKYGSPAQQERYEWIRSLMVVHFSENLLSDYQSTIGRIVANLHRGGVGILAGTDNGGFYGFGLHQELGLMVEAGLSPLESLQTATLNSAKYFGRSDELGTVEQGKLADLVLLDANPLKDISNTKKIQAVVANGRLYQQDELDRMLQKIAEKNSGITIATLIYRKIQEEGIEAARDYHRGLLESQPDTVLFNENSHNRLGYRLMQQERIKEAVSVFEMNVEAYPEEPNPYHSLGDAYRAAGRLNEAKRSYEQAVTLAKKQDHPNLKVYRASLERVTQKLEEKN